MTDARSQMATWLSPAAAAMALHARRSCGSSSLDGSDDQRRARRRPQGGAGRAERDERPRLHPVDVQRAREPGDVRAPADLGLGQRVRRLRRRQHDPPVRVRGLQPHHRPRLAVRQHHPAAGAPVPARCRSPGARRVDVRASRTSSPTRPTRTRAATSRATWPRMISKTHVLGIIGPIATSVTPSCTSTASRPELLRRRQPLTATVHVSTPGRSATTA